jgi:hypothetical protein
MPLLFLILSGIAVAAMAAVGSSRRVTMRAGEVWTLDFSVTTEGTGESDVDLNLAVTTIVTVLGTMPGLGIPIGAKPTRDHVMTVVVKPTTSVTIDLGQSFSFPVPTIPGATIRITLQSASRAPAA